VAYTQTDPPGAAPDRVLWLDTASPLLCTARTVSEMERIRPTEKSPKPLIFHHFIYRIMADFRSISARCLV